MEPSAKIVNSFNLFPTNAPMLYPVKQPENLWLSGVFTGGIKWEHWPEMG